MVRSMTAFARAETTGEWGKLTWELRTVNHRYLDISARLPEDLRAVEPVLRERVGARLSRGKIECTLRYRPATGVVNDVQVNWPYVERLAEAAERVGGYLPEPAPVSAIEVLRMPGALRETEPDLEPVGQAAATLLEEALDNLIEVRAREGERLAELIAGRAQRLGELGEAVRERRPQLLERLRERYRARLAELAVQADEGRLEQEMAMVAQRLDVDEELDRLQTHVDEVRAVLERDEPIGRRLDFLMQELNREANTLSSKSSDSETTQMAVEMKVLIEQIREQVQNIE